MAVQSVRVRVWDLPTRLFHWTLVVCVVGAVVSAKIGGNAMVWHFRLGYAVFALLAFRLLWGFVGGRWSRFASFVPSPTKLMRYVRGSGSSDEHQDVGHNPLGALSVLALLTLLAAQVGSGLFADDEIANSGPLVRLVSSDTSSLLTGWHAQWGQWLILALVALHVGAILFYRFARSRDLVTPMIVGDKLLSASTPASADGTASRLVALVLVALCGAGVGWLVSLGG